MADLDVSELLVDPDFADRLQCVRQQQTVDEQGIARNVQQVSNFIGVVTSDKGTELARLAAGARVSGSILVHTRFRLSNGHAGHDADEIVWRGNRYTVVAVDDYSQYGAGFVCASCDLVPLAGVAP